MTMPHTDNHNTDAQDEIKRLRQELEQARADLERARRLHARPRVQDDTELKTSHKNFKHTNRLLVTMLDNTHVHVAFMDADFNFILVNRAYADGAGHPVDFFPGKNHFALFPHDENQAIFKNTVETGEPHYTYAKAFEFPDQPERGVTYWDWSLIPITDNGHVTAVLLSLSDVTERMRMRLDMERSEKKYRALYESSRDGFVMMDLQNRILECNQAFADMLGYTQNELRDRVARDITPEKWQAVIEKSTEQLFTRGYTPLYEKEYRRKDGSVFPVELRKHLERDENGEPESMWAFVRDISERKNSERQIRDLAKFPEENPMPVMRINTKCLVTYANQRAREILCSLSSGPGRQIPAHWKDFVDTAMATGTVQVHSQVADNIHYSFFFAPIQNLGYLNIYGSDITHLRQAEAALRRSEEDLRLVIQASRDAIWDWLPQDDTMTVSDRWYEILEFDEERFPIGAKSQKERIHPNDYYEVASIINNVVQGRMSHDHYAIECRQRTKNGDWKWVLIRGMVVERDAQGKALRIVGAMTDINEHKRIEEELNSYRMELEKLVEKRTGELTLANKQLKNLSRKIITAQEEERARVAMNLHDEMGQQLTALTMEVEWLQKKGEVVQEDMQNLEDTIHNIHQALQRIYKGLRPAALDNLGLEAAIQSLIWEYRDFYDFEIKTDIKPGACDMEPDRAIIVYRILQEALTNAARHSKATRVDISMIRGDHEIILEIRDNGVGLGSDDSQESRQGFGIMGMRERAAIAGGKLSLASEPGCGACIKFVLNV
jgi:two-component system sensor histidine kinase UhpB